MGRVRRPCQGSTTPGSRLSTSTLLRSVQCNAIRPPCFRAASLCPPLPYTFPNVSGLLWEVGWPEWGSAQSPFSAFFLLRKVPVCSVGQKLNALITESQPPMLWSINNIHTWLVVRWNKSHPSDKNKNKIWCQNITLLLCIICKIWTKPIFRTDRMALHSPHYASAFRCPNTKNLMKYCNCILLKEDLKISRAKHMYLMQCILKKDYQICICILISDAIFHVCASTSTICSIWFLL